MIETKKITRWQDIKIFLKDYFKVDFKEIKKTLKKPALYSNTLFILTIIYFIVKIITSLVQGIKPTTSIVESIAMCLIIILAIIFQMISAYKSGAHRFRNKELYNGKGFKEKEEFKNIPVKDYNTTYEKEEMQEEVEVTRAGNDNLEKEPEIKEITYEEKLSENLGQD